MKIIRVFDLDGTLIDSREAVVACYAEAGVAMPPKAWGLPWAEWGPAACAAQGITDHQNVHRTKERLWPKYRERVRHLPTERFLRDGDDNRDEMLVILTAAGASAVAGYLHERGIYRRVSYRHGVTLAERIATIHVIEALHNQHFDGGEIFDDDLNNCQALRERLGDFWTIYHVMPPTVRIPSI